jgi:hypothetical protein
MADQHAVQMPLMQNSQESTNHEVYREIPSRK